MCRLLLKCRVLGVNPGLTRRSAEDDINTRIGERRKTLILPGDLPSPCQGIDGNDDFRTRPEVDSIPPFGMMGWQVLPKHRSCRGMESLVLGENGVSGSGVSRGLRPIPLHH